MWTDPNPKICQAPGGKRIIRMLGILDEEHLCVLRRLQRAARADIAQHSGSSPRIELTNILSATPTRPNPTIGVCLPARPNNPRRIPRPPTRPLIQRLSGLPLGTPILLAVLRREVHLALALPVLRVDLSRHDRGLARGGARGPRGERLVAQEPVPRPPGVAERAGLEEGVEQVVRVEAPEGVVLAPDVEVRAGWLSC